MTFVKPGPAWDRHNNLAGPYIKKVHFTISYSKLEHFIIFSYTFSELLLTSIYDLNTNVNSRGHNFLWLPVYCK